MNSIVLALKTIRIPNLLMLALVQYIVCTNLLQVFTLSFYLTTTIATLLIASGGYILNDVQDLEIDQLNNKLKWVNPTNKKIAQSLSVGLLILGLSIGLIVSLQCSVKLFSLFLLAAFLLVSYAYYFSKYKVIGNLMISFLIALAILLCFYLGIEHPAFTRKYFNMNEIAVWVYAGMAFLLNWIREIVKDMEDIEGDKIGGRKTLPILLGIRICKGIIFIVMLFFFTMIVFLAIMHNEDSIFKLYLASFLIVTGGGMKSLISATDSQSFERCSLYIKGMMLIGLLLPISNYL